MRRKMFRTNLDYFEYAYHRGRWVVVPLFFVPDDAVGDDGNLHHFQLIPVDGQELPEPPLRRCVDLAYERISCDIKETILPWMLSKEEVTELCTRNNIPLLWVTGDQRNISINSKSHKSTRRDKRKYTCLNKTEYKRFIKNLKCINAQSSIIAQILWFFNSQLQAGDDYITLDEVLRLKVEDVDLEHGTSTCIKLHRSSTQGSHMVVHWLPEYIWTPLCQLIQQDSYFVFSNKNRGPLLPSDVARCFKKAGEVAEIKGTVSSLSLRPIGLKNFSTQRFQEISILEWDTLCLQVPNLIASRGTRPKHDQRCVFNAILYHLRTKTPIRKLPSIYPPAKAIHSQCRRWKKNGVFDLVLAARQ